VRLRRQTQRFSVRPLLQRARLAGSYGGIKIQAAKGAGYLASAHLLFDELGGFSAIMKMFTRDPATTLSSRSFGGVKEWTTRAPMLALSDPDPALGFPAGTRLQPKVFVRNASARTYTAHIHFNWRTATSSGTTAPTDLVLKANATQVVDVAALQAQKRIPSDAHWAAVVLSAPVQPDELLAVASSYDESGRFGAQTPFNDQLAFHWEAGKWEVDSMHNSLVTVGNGGNQTVRAELTILYNQGREQYQLEQKLAPEEQMLVDFGKLIHDRIPDKSGRVLPPDLTSGAYRVRDLTDEAVGNLYEGKVTVDKTNGHAAYGCAICCGYVDPPVMKFDPLAVAVSGSGGQTVLGTNGCTQQQQDVTYDFPTWWTDNTAIATAQAAKITGVSAGSTNHNAQSRLMSWSGKTDGQCPQNKGTGSGGTNVNSVSQTPSALNMSNGDTGKTLGVTVSGPAGTLVVSSGLTSNPNSSTNATATIPGKNNFTGNTNLTISVTPAPPSYASGIFYATACVGLACSNQGTTINVPPQVLIQMMYAEANGTNNTTAMEADGDVVRNRFGSSLFNPPYSTYQNTIVSGQFAYNTSITTGVEPELDGAVSVFTSAGGNFCNSLAFWTPTSSQWTTVQNAINSKTTTFPSGTGSPTYGSIWPSSAQQILYLSAVGTQGNGGAQFAPWHHLLHLLQKYRSPRLPRVLLKASHHR
jgi:hypothetical protein